MSKDIRKPARQRHRGHVRLPAVDQFHFLMRHVNSQRAQERRDDAAVGSFATPVIKKRYLLGREGPFKSIDQQIIIKEESIYLARFNAVLDNMWGWWGKPPF